MEANGIAPSPRSVGADRGIGWITDGWARFARAPGPWLLLTLVALVVMFVAGAVPLIGNLLSPFVSSLVMAGLLLAAAKQQEGGEPELADLFSILNHRALQPLLILTLIYVGLCIVAAVVIFGVFGGGGAALALLGGAGDSDGVVAAGMGSMLLGVLLFIAVLVPIIAMYWYGLPLVLFRGVEPWAAMKASLAGALANIVPLFVYGIVSLVAVMLGAIPLGLGLLIVMPVLLVSWLISYHEIFAEGEPQKAAPPPPIVPG